MMIVHTIGRGLYYILLESQVISRARYLEFVSLFEVSAAKHKPFRVLMDGANWNMRGDLKHRLRLPSSELHLRLCKWYIKTI